MHAIFTSRLQRLLKDRDGVSALEFALILPFMALLFFGSIELSLYIEADRRVTSTASTLGDLSARLDKMTYCDIEDILNASTLLIRPNSASEVKMRISAIRDDGGAAKVSWSHARNMGAFNDDETLTLANGVLPGNGEVIMAEVSYDYNSALGYFFPTTQTLDDYFYLRPRQDNTLPWQGSRTDPGNCNLPVVNNLGACTGNCGNGKGNGGGNGTANEGNGVGPGGNNGKGGG